MLTFASQGLVTQKPATWLEEAFWGRRWVLSAGFGDIGPPTLPLFPLYFEHRDRVACPGRELSLVVASFADAGHLRIEEIGPASATRRPSRLRTGAEIITIRWRHELEIERDGDRVSAVQSRVRRQRASG